MDKTATATPDMAIHPTETKSSSRRLPTKWIVVAILLIAAIGSATRIKLPSVAGSAAPADTPQITTIEAARVSRGPIGYYVEALGTVTPLAMVNLYSQVNGTVMSVHYAEGQIVQRGDPLIDIDPRPYVAQLKEVEGTLQRDKASLVQAEQDLERYKDAYDQQAVSRQTYDDQKQTVEQDRGTVQNDIGQVEYARTQLAYCHLTAPISGRVGLRLVDPGNTIFSGGSSPLLVITQLEPISVVFNVAEDDLDQVRHEIVHRARLPIDVYDRAQLARLATGRLLTLDNQIDTSTGTVRFRGQFDNSDLKLYPNQFVNARLLVKTLQDALLVPSAAVQRNSTDAFVYVVSGSKVTLRKVTVLTTEQGMAAVNGVQPGEVVSTTGFDKLEDGSPVKVQDIDGSGKMRPANNAKSTDGPGSSL